MCHANQYFEEIKPLRKRRKGHQGKCSIVFSDFLGISLCEKFKIYINT